jgi:hypothetical protein
MNIHRDMVTCIYAIEFYQATYSMTNAEGRSATINSYKRFLEVHYILY